jgi:sugar phosphate isomerase/epimerase
LNDIEKSFEAASLEISVLGCYIEPSVRDRDKRLENVKIFTDNISHAKTLGIDIVGTETTHLDTEVAPGEREEMYLLLKDSVQRMLDKAEKEDIQIGIEPVAEHTLNTPSLARRLLDELQSDKLKIIFDPVNLVLPHTIDMQRDIFSETFKLLGDEIAVVHMKDIAIENNKKTWRNIGAGLIDYGFIFNWLAKHKPDIRLLREGVDMDSYGADLAAMIELNRKD